MSTDDQKRESFNELPKEDQLYQMVIARIKANLETSSHLYKKAKSHREQVKWGQVNREYQEFEIWLNVAYRNIIDTSQRTSAE